MIYVPSRSSRVWSTFDHQSFVSLETARRIRQHVITALFGIIAVGIVCAIVATFIEHYDLLMLPLLVACVAISFTQLWLLLSETHYGQLEWVIVPTEYYVFKMRDRSIPYGLISRQMNVSRNSTDKVLADALLNKKLQVSALAQTCTNLRSSTSESYQVILGPLRALDATE